MSRPPLPPAGRGPPLPPAGRGPLTPYARLVLDAVDAIPRGRVLTYGDVAEYVGRPGARPVGMVLARWGSEVPWHRVVTAAGRPAPGHERAALERLRAEGVPLLAGGSRVDLVAARWDGRAARAPDRG